MATDGYMPRVQCSDALDDFPRWKTLDLPRMLREISVIALTDQDTWPLCNGARCGHLIRDRGPRLAHGGRRGDSLGADVSRVHPVA